MPTETMCNSNKTGRIAGYLLKGDVKLAKHYAGGNAGTDELMYTPHVSIGNTAANFNNVQISFGSLTYSNTTTDCITTFKVNVNWR